MHLMAQIDPLIEEFEWLEQEDTNLITIHHHCCPTALTITSMPDSTTTTNTEYVDLFSIIDTATQFTVQHTYDDQNNYINSQNHSWFHSYVPVLFTAVSFAHIKMGRGHDLCISFLLFHGAFLSA